MESKKLRIDFLYLDLTQCERCMAAGSNLDEAVGQAAEQLCAEGFEVCVNKVHMADEIIARKYRFLASPTIRINGRDISLTVKENSCSSCGELCGDDVTCRVFTYKGEDYEEPPAEMIKEAILNEVYSAEKKKQRCAKYKMPQNLVKFYKGQATMKGTTLCKSKKQQ